VGRLEGGRCLLDLRSVAPEEDSRLVAAVLAAAATLAPGRPPS
jgi:L-seryl-tRNA(Ser) seleniumtransferase